MQLDVGKAAKGYQFVGDPGVTQVLPLAAHM